MKAVVWHGPADVRVDDVDDPKIETPTDAVIKVTSTAICGSDLHLYEIMAPFMSEGDILGHEPMGIVEEVGAEVEHIEPGDRVVIPFNISCGNCWMCDRELYAQCETTQNREQEKGASLFGYTKLYGQVPGGQAEYLRVPQAQFGPIKVPEGPPDDRFLYLSDVLPTAWQAVEYASPQKGSGNGKGKDAGTLAVFGLGPIGQMAARIGVQEGHRVIAVDLVPERIALAEKHGIETLDLEQHEEISDAIRELTDGRGADAAIDAVGMEAHGSPVGELAQKAAGLLHDKVAEVFIEKAGIDRMAALYHCIDSVRRGGTVSVSGVYGGMVDPMPMFQLFDKGVEIRMGQAHVKRWIDDLMPLVTDDEDPLGTADLASHKIPNDGAPDAYEMFQKKEDGATKVVIEP